MTLASFNQLDRESAAKELFACCGSSVWVNTMMQDFPFASEEALVESATSAWYRQCGKKDWLESFTHHPRIGDKSRLQEKFAGTEQAAVATATDAVIDDLLRANHDYEKKNGFIFIVCATGRSAGEMLRLLNERLQNSTGTELRIAMGEQHKITLIRLKKLLSDANLQFLNMSQLTTHVLDTSIGKPGKGITTRLMQHAEGSWQSIAQGITNDDGRISDLLPAAYTLAPGQYKLVFGTGDYFTMQGVTGFYPEVEITFIITDDSHYHVPLLISPYGYSTYRGS